MSNNGLSDRLRELRKVKKLRQIDLSSLAHISASYYNDIETRGKMPSQQVLEQLAEALGVTVGYLKGEKVESTDLKNLNWVSAPIDVVLIPLVGEVRAGLSMYAQNNIESYVRVDGKQIDSDKTYFFLEVVGDSMDKIIREGDKVLVEHTSDVDTGDIAIVLMNDNSEATIKKIRLKDNMVVLIPSSYNPAHVIQSYRHDEVTIIGKVIKAERFF